MIDNDFIKDAYNTMDRGFPELRKRKRLLAGRSVLKNLLFILFVKQEKSSNHFFLLHPHAKIEKIFPNAVNIDKTNAPFLKKAIVYLQLGYIVPSNRIRFWIAKKAFKFLKYYFSSSSIKILNCGPSILSPFLAKLCEKKQDGSKYYIIQHGLYQLDYKPYNFEFSIAASRTIVWSEILAQNYISMGMAPEKIKVLPTHLFRTIKELNTSKKVLIIGESINKINPGFDEEYQHKLLKVVNYLKHNTKYNEFYFKKHPRALPSPQLDEALEDNSIIFLNTINLNDYGLLIGGVSTLMIEGLAEGCRVLQLSMEKLQINVGDYSLYTSIENLQEIKKIKEKINTLDKLKYNYINSKFLRVDYNYKESYRQLLK